jgi:hypothetical protein
MEQRWLWRLALDNFDREWPEQTRVGTGDAESSVGAKLRDSRLPVMPKNRAETLPFVDCSGACSMRGFAYESKRDAPRLGRRVFYFIGIILPIEPVQERSGGAGWCRALVRNSRRGLFLQEGQPSYHRADKGRSRRALPGYVLLLCIVRSRRGPGLSASPIRGVIAGPVRGVSAGPVRDCVLTISGWDGGQAGSAIHFLWHFAVDAIEDLMGQFH